MAESVQADLPETPSLHPAPLMTCLVGGWLGLVGSSVGELFQGKLDHPVKRGVWLLVVLPLVTLKLGVDGVSLLLDEVFFAKAKSVPVLKPVFVIGPPRSGTTFLHRVLAEDREQFVTSPAWEVLFAPSVVQKKFFRAVLSMDRKLGRPLVRLFRSVEALLLKAFEDTHPGSLSDPEEDYFYLSSICACTGWLLVFPSWNGIRKGMPGQPEASDTFRRQALTFYRYCLQKQLYVEGGSRILLSKNASFASWMDLLPEVFRDARFLITMRDPAETIPSMLSTAEESVRASFATAGENRLQPVLLDEMVEHYTVLHKVVPTLPGEQVSVVERRDLKEHLEAVVRTSAERLTLDFSEEFWNTLPRRSEDSRSHTSAHSYELSDFGLNAETLRKDCPTLKASPIL